MESGTAQIVVWLVGQLVVAGAIWGGIRAEIKNMHERLDDIRDQLEKVRKRVDRIVERRVADS